MKKQVLNSSSLVYAPNIVRAAVNDYRIDDPAAKFRAITFMRFWEEGLTVATMFGILDGSIPFTIEDKTVVIGVEE